MYGIKHLIYALILWSSFSLFYCETKPTAPAADNPLDIVNPETGGDPFELTAKIADGGILLEWNNPQIKTISAFKVYRSEIETIGYKAISTISKDKNKFTDRFIQNGRSYWYRITALDENNKESEITNTAAVNVKTEPLLVINGDDLYTSVKTVKLTILAEGAIKMIISNNNSFSDASWEVYKTSKIWTLENGPGQKIVYMKVKYDTFESAVVSDTILPQDMNPGIVINNNTSQYTSNPNVRINLSADGENLEIKIGEDSIFTDAIWQSYTENIDYELSTGDGIKTLYAKFKNDFSIKSKIVKDDIILDTTPPKINVIVSQDSGIARETYFLFDASKSADNISSIDDLKIRYDFDNNNYFTLWHNLPKISHLYLKGGGNKKIKIQLKDLANCTSDTMLNVFVNTRPKASFVGWRHLDNPKICTFDASESSDYEDSNSLEYRWDFDGNGIWDTGWLTLKSIDYEYDTEEQYQVNLVVRDQNKLLSRVVSDNIDSNSFKVRDIDGNLYKTVRIGNQWWMAEDLKVTHYRNGDPIPIVSDYAEWANLTNGAYCYKDNDAYYTSIYGLLYNWYVIEDSRNIAPEGWHVPSDIEWQALNNYLGGENVAGGKLKQTGYMYWNAPNTGATNEFGFNALGGSYRDSTGIFGCNKCNIMFWSASEFNANKAKLFSLYNTSVRVFLFNYSKNYGGYIRCIKD